MGALQQDWDAAAEEWELWADQRPETGELERYKLQHGPSFHGITAAKSLGSPHMTRAVRPQAFRRVPDASWPQPS